MLANSAAAFQTVLICGREVDAAIDAAHASFARRVGEAVETADDAGQAVGRCHKMELVTAAELGEDGGRSSTECTVSRSVFGKGGRDK